MQFTTALVVLFAAMGVTATPVEPRVDATLVEPGVDGQVGTLEIRKGVRIPEAYTSMNPEIERPCTKHSTYSIDVRSENPDVQIQD